MTVVPGGPVLVEGPVEVTLEDGTVVLSDRFMTALCACRRSRAYPFCDTSHRRRVRTDRDGDSDRDGDRNSDRDTDGAES
ncbi:CDGSH iron-sulfur domain-containing protein [Actinomadura rudentiformis]|uniref:CDGSH iron-sulfur domain-containing protein n=1 Tax=Actinomadura rudentiformis TaxID=359158 RepID=A0A6H9YVX3_9ACTN|nr:CDGSH iron-sulfur domain-containing protein [Actinomadura rudentiformis]